VLTGRAGNVEGVDNPLSGRVASAGIVITAPPFAARQARQIDNILSF
jgi:hypothetical protein